MDDLKDFVDFVFAIHGRAQGLRLREVMDELKDFVYCLYRQVWGPPNWGPQMGGVQLGPPVGEPPIGSPGP